MRVTDGNGRTWTVIRRLSPWRRVIQPVNIPLRAYRHYRIAPPASRDRPFRGGRGTGKGRGRRGRRPPTANSLLDLLGELVAEVVQGVVGVVLFAAVLIAWLLLLPLATAELLAQVVAGSLLWLGRVAGLVRARVDVVARPDGTVRITSLTVLTVRGFGAAGRLLRAVAEERAGASAPFDPREPAVAATLVGLDARVESHDAEEGPARGPSGRRRRRA